MFGRSGIFAGGAVVVIRITDVPFHRDDLRMVSMKGHAFWKSKIGQERKSYILYIFEYRKTLIVLRNPLMYRETGCICERSNC